MYLSQRQKHVIRSHDRAESGLTSVRICGPHHYHRGTDACRLPEAQTVVLLLGEHWHLVVCVVHVYDDLQRMDSVYVKYYNWKRNW